MAGTIAAAVAQFSTWQFKGESPKASDFFDVLYVPKAPATPEDLSAQLTAMLNGASQAANGGKT